MRLVIKIGGQAAEEPKLRRSLARQIAQLARSGHRVTVVHGGGKLLTETLARMGIKTEFWNGLRITNGAVRDIALMVLAGMINKQWVADIESHGQPALGICGGDAGLVRARRLKLRSKGRLRDLGFVGRPVKVNPALLEMASERGVVPVIASLALDARNEYLNVNADDLAAALASALEADRLFYLSESGGVWDADRKLLAKVRVCDIRSLIAKGVVRDGMIPKLRSCARTLARNVKEIDIVSPAAPNVLIESLRQGSRAVGTRVVKD